MDGFESSAAVIVVAATNRPEVLDAALLSARPLRPPRHRPASRQGRPPPDPRGPHPVAAAGRRRQPRQPRQHDARHGRRRHRQPLQRGGPARRPPRAREGHPRRLHGLAREDRARRAARPRAVRRGEAPHGLPRGRSRTRRHAHPGRRPRPQGLDHPALDVARRDHLRPRRGAHQLRRGAPDHAHQGLARRPRRRGDRLRLDQRRRRVRHPAADRRSPARWSAAGG